MASDQRSAELVHCPHQPMQTLRHLPCAFLTPSPLNSDISLQGLRTALSLYQQTQTFCLIGCKHLRDHRVASAQEQQAFEAGAPHICGQLRGVADVGDRGRWGELARNKATMVQKRDYRDSRDVGADLHLKQSKPLGADGHDIGGVKGVMPLERGLKDNFSESANPRSNRGSLQSFQGTPGEVADTIGENEVDTEAGIADYCTETDWDSLESHRFVRKGHSAFSSPRRKKQMPCLVLNGIACRITEACVSMQSDIAPTESNGSRETDRAHEEGRESGQLRVAESEALAGSRFGGLSPKSKALHNIVETAAVVAEGASAVAPEVALLLTEAKGNAYSADMVVEVVSGADGGIQLEIYTFFLLVGILMALALRKLKALSYRGTFYPKLLSSLLTAAAAWGIVDVAIEVAARGDLGRRLLYYFFLFSGSAAFVGLHMLMIDRDFSEVLQRFI
ncbi:hypothetical protein cyc_07591 [Cyclospora cayetanensis]|uniref:Transmembrane protein n=1 Tax=Cyclospora cayetanensis TaxID=88456 RepID=A0A1D3CV55_9EIME|nr:hypothetical protein cyc_07591 [Cyclospora cayetanensis]